MPIKDIQELNLPEYATLSDATFSAVDMGDRTISTQLHIDGDITPDFSFDWELSYRGEKYIYKFREPQSSKDTSSRKAKYDLLFRHWAIDKLTTEYYVKLYGEGVNAVVDQYVKPINYDLKEFCDDFNRVLSYYWGDSIQVDLNPKWEYLREPKLVSISYTKCWDLLQQMYQLFDVRWTFEAVQDGSEEALRNEKYVIKVGYPTPEIDKIFEYGKSANGEYGGLVKFERQQQDNNIANKLLGRGGEKNLPLYYFKTAKEDSVWASDPDAIPETENLEYYGNLRGQTYRDYVRGFGVRRYGKTAPPVSEQRWAYTKGYEDGAPNRVFRPIEFVKDDESIAKFGEIIDGLDNNDNIFPTIQGIEVSPYGRIDECVYVEQVITDEAENSTSNDSILSNIPSFSFSPSINYNETKAIVFKSINIEVVKDKSTITFDKPIFTAIITGRDTTDVSSYFDVNSTMALKNISDNKYYETSNIPKGTYYLECSAIITNNWDNEGSYRKIPRINISCNNIKVIQGDINDKWKPTFNIWVKNIWGSTKYESESNVKYVSRVWDKILGDKEGSKAAVMFSDGNLAHEDYEFTIIKGGVTYDTSKSLNGVNSEWKLTLEKSDAEEKALGNKIPYTKKQGSAGDHLFFIGIDMPHQYVLWAEDKLDKYKEDALLQTAKNNPTFVLDFDHVQWDKWADKEYEDFIGDIHEGYRIRATDKRFITDEAYKQLYVQSKEVKWENGKLLKRPSIVVTDKVMPVINPINQIQGEVDSLRSQLVGLSTTEQFIRLVGDKIYLRKDGVADRSISPTEFSSLVTDTAFRQGAIGGKGWGFYKDDNGNSILELDKLVLRQDLQVNNLVSNQITVVGGKEVLSAANATITRVDETPEGYVCYFDQRQGTVANMFIVGDVALCQVFSPENMETKFYKRKVEFVSENTITLSKTITNGDGVPEVSDVIVQYGNYTDTSRRYVIIRDVIGGGYERMLSGLDSVDSDGVEYYFAGRQTGQGVRWFIGDANNNIEYKNNQLNVRAKVTFTSGSSGLGNLDEWAEAEESINNAQSTADDAVRGTQAVNDYVQALESDVNAEIVAVNKRLDGVIENYFELYDPTIDNYPANEWVTDKLKEDHNGDTFTNKTTGNSWKWKIIDGVWKWDEITDTIEKELLKKIAKAQETADGKIRNFVFTPYPPYSVGDTWTQGVGGDFMRCIVSRSAGVFVPSDWDLASKYTDDAAANAAQAAATAAMQAARDEEQARISALNVVNTTLGSLQNQVDGVVENWFYEPAPLATNIPASTWTTVAIKRNHVGDTYTSIAQSPATQAGKSWRWVENPAGTFLWTPISDSDAVKALQEAAKAQSTADGKSTTFLVQPSNYRKGDMWLLAASTTVNGIVYKKGELLTANANSTTYEHSHWSKQVTYTDDTVANNIQTSAVNYLKDSRMDNLSRWVTADGTVTLVEDPKFGTVVQYQRLLGWGGYQHDFDVYNRSQFSNCDVIYYVIAKAISDGSWAFGGWRETVSHLSNSSNSIDLGDGWRMYWVSFKAGATLGADTFGINSIMGTWQFYAAGVSLGKNPPSSWTIAEGDLKGSIEIATARLDMWASDSIISPPEKTGLRQQRSNIISEYERINVDAARYKVDITAYKGAYVSAISALDKYSSPLPEDIAVGDDYANISAYYQAREAIEKAIDAEASVVKSKDDFAKSLGYIDYADMVSKGTIIDGGYIKTEVIDTEKLVSENIRTNINGKRVEILGKKFNNDPRVRIFDDLNNECITISGNKLDNFIPSTTSIDYINNIGYKKSESKINPIQNLTNSVIYYTEVKTELCSFYYSGKEQVKIPYISCELNINNYLHPSNNILNLYSTFNINIEIQKLNESTGTWVVHNSILLKNTTVNGISETFSSLPIESFVGSGIAMYRIYLSLSSICYINIYVNNYNIDAYTSFSINVYSRPIEIIYSSTNFSSINSNGILSYWGPNKYFGAISNPNTDFIKSVDGRFGFKLNGINGFLLSTNANSSNWNMPMNCVLMGSVSYNGILLSYISSTNNLKVTTTSINSGRFKVSMYNNNYGKSTYFNTAEDYIAFGFSTDNVNSGYILIEPNRKSDQFHINSYEYNGDSTQQRSFIFFIIDLRYWMNNF